MTRWKEELNQEVVKICENLNIFKAGIFVIRRSFKKKVCSAMLEQSQPRLAQCVEYRVWSVECGP